MAKKKWEQDPNQPEQQVMQLSQSTQANRNKPEETLRQQAIARAAGNVPLPPETAAERGFRPISETQKEAISKLSQLPSQEEITQPEAPKQGMQRRGEHGLPVAQGDVQDVIRGAMPNIAANIISKTAGGAGAGAVTGSIVPGLGTAAGAIAGGIGGLGWGISSAYGEIKKEAALGVNVKYTDFKGSKSNIKTILRAAKTDPLGAVEAYQAEWAKIERGEREFKAMEEKDWLYKARPELTAIRSFRSIKSEYDALLMRAIAGEDVSALLPMELE